MQRDLTWRWAPVWLALATACGPLPARFWDEPAFSPDWILEVEIELEADDWDQLRFQRRAFDELIGANCLQQPFANPFTNFQADVTIDGMRVERVGVRKKCFFGSCDSERPALKVAFNEYQPGRRFLGMRRMTLNNCKQDPSKIKQCLGYWLFARAGVPAPRCNFAHLTVNGKDLGIYAHVESIQEEFLARHFADTTGNLYEGSLSDFRPGWTGTFQKKTNEENPDRSDLEQMTEVLAGPDAGLVEGLERILDLDGFFTFWAMEVLTAHWDGYAGNTNNFYLYRDPQSGRFHFIPWGNDGTLALLGPPEQNINMVMATGLLARRLYLLPQTREIYVQRLQELLAEVWNNDAILAEIDRLERLIAPYADPYATGELRAQIGAVRNFVVEQPRIIKEEIAAGPPPWEQPLREPICMEEIGSVSASFQTTWGSISSPDPFAAGTGTLEVVVNGSPVGLSAVFSVAGMDPNPQNPKPEPLLQIIGVVPGEANDTYLVVQIIFHDPALIASGIELPLDMERAFGIVYHFDPAANSAAVVGLLLLGSLEFTRAGTSAGAAIEGSLSATMTESAW